MEEDRQQQGPEASNYTECFVAYLDILGFSRLVTDSAKNPEHLRALTRALNVVAALPSGTKESRHHDADGHWVERKWNVQTRPFSDTMVIFMPTESDCASQMLFMVRYLHDRMLELELCVRGAVTIGGMYWNESWSQPAGEHRPTSESQRDVLYDRNSGLDLPVTLGPGLIEAYELESQCAIYPRILISERVIQYAQKHDSASFPLVQSFPKRALTTFFRRDADGFSFLDVLNAAITRSDTERIVKFPTDRGFSIRWERDENSHERVLSAIEDLTRSKIEDSSCSAKIRAKYEWLNSYAETVRMEMSAG